MIKFARYFNHHDINKLERRWVRIQLVSYYRSEKTIDTKLEKRNFAASIWSETVILLWLSGVLRKNPVWWSTVSIKSELIMYANPDTSCKSWGVTI